MSHRDESTNELWRVQLADGAIRTGTLDQLDEAYQAGHIDESTLVQRPGTHRWVTLGQAAGLEESQPAHVQPPSSLSAIAISVADAAPRAPVATMADLDVSPDELQRPRRSRTVLAVATGLALVAGGIGVLGARTQVGSVPAPPALAAAGMGPVPQPAADARLKTSAPSPAAPTAITPVEAAPPASAAPAAPAASASPAASGATRAPEPERAAPMAHGRPQESAPAKPKATAAGKPATGKPGPGKPGKKALFQGSGLKGDPLDGTL